MTFKAPTSYINEFGSRIPFPQYTLFQKIKKDSEFQNWDAFAEFARNKNPNGYPHVIKVFDNLPFSDRNTLFVPKEIHNLYAKTIPRFSNLPLAERTLVAPVILAKFAKILAADLDTELYIKLQRDQQKWKV